MKNHNHVSKGRTCGFGGALTGVLFLGLSLCSQINSHAQGVPVDLSGWTAERGGSWVVAPDSLSVVLASGNLANLTFFYSDFELLDPEIEGGTAVIEGTITVETSGDDDYIGFALGFQPGDSTNPNADYLLIDWKQATQSYNFGGSSCTPGSTAYRGLAVSRVFGVPTLDEFWGHKNWNYSCSNRYNGVQQLTRGMTLGNVGWADLRTYTFRVEFSTTSLHVYVDGLPQISLGGAFSNGRLAFYNFSQTAVRYSVLKAGIDYAPVVTLNGDTPMEVECGGDFVDPGVDVWDDQDPDPVVTVEGDVDTSCVGSHTITYTATDDMGNSASVQRIVNVVDTTAPSLTASASTSEIGPPNHKMVPVILTIMASDDCPCKDVSVDITVSSNQDANGLGDGNTDPDWLVGEIDWDDNGIGTAVVNLRAERSGKEGTRIYTIAVTATDGDNVSVIEIPVSVAHDQGNGGKKKN